MGNRDYFLQKALLGYHTTINVQHILSQGRKALGTGIVIKHGESTKLSEISAFTMYSPSLHKHLRLGLVAFPRGKRKQVAYTGL